MLDLPEKVSISNMSEMIFTSQKFHSPYLIDMDTHLYLLTRRHSSGLAILWVRMEAIAIFRNWQPLDAYGITEHNSTFTHCKYSSECSQTITSMISRAQITLVAPEIRGKSKRAVVKNHNLLHCLSPPQSSPAMPQSSDEYGGRVV